MEASIVTVNRSYLHPLAVMLKSVAQQHPGRYIRVFVLHRSLVPEDLDRVARAVDAPDLELAGIRADDRLFAGAPTTGRYPCGIYDRIFAARYLPKDLNPVLYLDPDLGVRQSARWTSCGPPPQWSASPRPAM